jgi:hypothetical protein
MAADLRRQQEQEGRKTVKRAPRPPEALTESTRSKPVAKIAASGGKPT